MPEYTNATTKSYSAGNSILLEPDAATSTDRYIPILPTGVTLTSHEPMTSPWQLLDTITSVPMEAPIDVYMWKNIIVYNATDDVITVSANTDDSNAMCIMASSKEVWSNEDGLFGCVEVVSMAGSGSVYIYGVK